MARKPGLGRGLTTLIPEGTQPTDVMPTVVVAEGPFREIDIAAITPNLNQPRQHFDEESLAALSASIKSMGVLQPIMVRPVPNKPDEFELIAGERRWRASRMAGLTTIPAYVQTEVDDALSLERAIVENLHRVDLSALEEASAYQQLIDDFSLTHEQIAERVGKSRTTVTNTLRLLQLGGDAQKALLDGAISAGHARALLAVADTTLQDKLVASITKNDLSVRATEEAVRDALAPQPAPPGGSAGGRDVPKPPRLKPVPEPGVMELEQLLEDLLSTRVHIDMKGKTGRVIIDFADLDDLERIYHEMSRRSGS